MNSNLDNASVNPTINAHDAANSHNLTNRECSNESDSDNINTSNVDFSTFLNKEVVADGTVAENLQNTIATVPLARGNLRLPNDENLDNNER